MQVWVASKSLDSTNNTGSDHAHFIVIAPPAYGTFFSWHQTCPLFWTSTRAKESSVGSLANLQPVCCKFTTHSGGVWHVQGNQHERRGEGRTVLVVQTGHLGPSPVLWRAMCRVVASQCGVVPLRRARLCCRFGNRARMDDAVSSCVLRAQLLVAPYAMSPMLPLVRSRLGGPGASWEMRRNYGDLAGSSPCVN
jgi:hypothetical protein